MLAVEEAIRSFSRSYEIIVSEDGSTDGTDSIVSKMAKFNANLFLLHSPTRLGKGKAIKNALNVSKGNIIVFMDVDLATSLECLHRLFQAVKENGGMAIGSRHVQGRMCSAATYQNPVQFNLQHVCSTVFFDGIHDHQCGFKMMDREAAETILTSLSLTATFLTLK